MVIHMCLVLTWFHRTRSRSRDRRRSRSRDRRRRSRSRSRSRDRKTPRREREERDRENRSKIDEITKETGLKAKVTYTSLQSSPKRQFDLWKRFQTSWPVVPRWKEIIWRLRPSEKCFGEVKRQKQPESWRNNKNYGLVWMWATRKRRQSFKRYSRL